MGILTMHLKHEIQTYAKTAGTLIVKVINKDTKQGKQSWFFKVPDFAWERAFAGKKKMYSTTFEIEETLVGGNVYSARLIWDMFQDKEIDIEVTQPLALNHRVDRRDDKIKSRDDKIKNLEKKVNENEKEIEQLRSTEFAKENRELKSYSYNTKNAAVEFSKYLVVAILLFVLPHFIDPLFGTQIVTHADWLFHGIFGVELWSHLE